MAIVLLFILAILGVSCQMGPCTDKSEYGCCAGTIWNESLGRCAECQDGYVGLFCDIPCKHPFYGRLCIEKCSCSISQCDFRFGCGSVSFKNAKSTHVTIRETTEMGFSVSWYRNATFSSSTYTVNSYLSKNAWFRISVHGMVILVISIVSLILLSAFISFAITRNYYSKKQSENIINDYQEIQRMETSERSYERVDIPNIFTGISNVHIIYERSKKMYKINLSQDMSEAEDDNPPASSEYDNLENTGA